jgi:putative peptidoglycan binding protein
MTLCLGMSGAYVKNVQEFLAGRSLYRGPLDSSYGGGTVAAVKTYQKQHGLQPSGMVDGPTWALMFPRQPAPVCDLLTRPLKDRCLALTGSFETSSYPPESFCGLSGDFDQMGISFGACQWNIGQGTLQPLLQQMFEQHSDVAQSIFHENFDILRSLTAVPLGEQLAFARSIQYKGQVNEPWRGMLAALGRTPEFQGIQIGMASKSFNRAIGQCQQYGLASERGAALMFDIVTQNGSVGSVVDHAILRDFTKLPPGGDNEVAKMVIIANRMADGKEYADDVRTRKLAVAQGTGTVHGYFYDLAEMFGITLKPFAVQAT